VASSNIECINSTKAQLASVYKMKDLGEMDWYLGMRYKRDGHTGTFAFLDQSKYIEDVLTKFEAYIGRLHSRYFLCNKI
jgi:hypothetical protein